MIDGVVDASTGKETSVNALKQDIQSRNNVINYLRSKGINNINDFSNPQNTTTVFNEVKQDINAIGEEKNSIVQLKNELENKLTKAEDNKLAMTVRKLKTQIKELDVKDKELDNKLEKLYTIDEYVSPIVQKQNPQEYEIQKREQQKISLQQQIDKVNNDIKFSNPYDSKRNDLFTKRNELMSNLEQLNSQDAQEQAQTQDLGTNTSEQVQTQPQAIEQAQIDNAQNQVQNDPNIVELEQEIAQARTENLKKQKKELVQKASKGEITPEEAQQLYNTHVELKASEQKPVVKENLTTEQQSLTPETQDQTNRIAEQQKQEYAKKQMQDNATTGTQGSMFNVEQFKDGQQPLIDTVTMQPNKDAIPETKETKPISKRSEFINSIKDEEFENKNLETIRGRFKNRYYSNTLKTEGNDIIRSERAFNEEILKPIRKNPEVVNDQTKVEALEERIQEILKNTPFGDNPEFFAPYYKKLYNAVGKASDYVNGKNEPKEESTKQQPTANDTQLIR